MSRKWSLALALFFATSLRSEAQSIVVTAGQDPDKVEQLGFATLYTAQPPANSPFPYKVDWSFQQTDCTPPSSVRGNGTGNDGRFIFGIPGTFAVQAVFTYTGVSNPTLNPNPPAPQTVKHSVTIAPPEVVDILGAGVPSDYATPSLLGPTAGSPTATSLGGQPGSWIYFILKSGGKTIGPYFNCTVQERLTK